MSEKSTAYRPKFNLKQISTKTILYVLLIFGAILSSFPFYWMLILATHTMQKIYPLPASLLAGSNR